MFSSHSFNLCHNWIVAACRLKRFYSLGPFWCSCRLWPQPRHDDWNCSDEPHDARPWGLCLRRFHKTLLIMKEIIHCKSCTLFPPNPSERLSSLSLSLFLSLAAAFQNIMSWLHRQHLRQLKICFSQIQRQSGMKPSPRKPSQNQSRLLGWGLVE